MNITKGTNMISPRMYRGDELYVGRVCVLSISKERKALYISAAPHFMGKCPEGLSFPKDTELHSTQHCYIH